MKQPKIITFALLGMLFLASCHKDKDPEPLPQLSVEPAPAQIAFTASDTKTYTYRVTTNQSAWKADSDREWCIVTPDYAAGTFTVTAQPNDATTPPPAATITVSAGEATPITFTATQEAAQYEVYVCGWYRTKTNNLFGCYWKDGEFFTLSVPYKYASVSPEMIAVDNGSVYVLGSYYDGNDRHYGHWKDGNFVPLDADPQSNSIGAFGFAGGSVYFGGRTLLNGAVKVCYWKDGTQKIFTESNGEDCDIEHIAVSGDKVYLAGDSRVGNLTRVCYWDNGEFIPLGEPGDREEIEANGIALSNGRVCVLGSVVDKKAQLWIDGKKQEYEFPQGVYFTFAEALCTAPDGALYILGKYGEADDTSCACWWDEKGNRTDLKNIYRVSGIAAAGGAVYVAGLSDRETPCYWKDDERFNLSVPDNMHEVDIENICVVKK